MSDQLHPIPNRNNHPIPQQNALLKGNQLRSLNQTFQLVLQPFDGNLVLYINDSAANPNSSLINRAVWSPHIQGRGGAIAVMQDDGNFVVYDDSQHALWSSGTSGNPGAFVILQDDGNLVVYAGDKRTPLFQSFTSVGEALGVNA